MLISLFFLSSVHEEITKKQLRSPTTKGASSDGRSTHRRHRQPQQSDKRAGQQGPHTQPGTPRQPRQRRPQKKRKESEKKKDKTNKKGRGLTQQKKAFFSQQLYSTAISLSHYGGKTVSRG